MKEATGLLHAFQKFPCPTREPYPSEHQKFTAGSINISTKLTVLRNTAPRHPICPQGNSSGVKYHSSKPAANAWLPMGAAVLRSVATLACLAFVMRCAGRSRGETQTHTSWAETCWPFKDVHLWQSPKVTFCSLELPNRPRCTGQGLPRRLWQGTHGLLSHCNAIKITK